MNLLTWLTLILFAASALCRPARARCPRSWALDTGVRPSGEFACYEPAYEGCLSAMPGRAADECYRGKPEPVAVGSKIWCTSGQRAIVVDGEAVGCMRGGWE